MARSDPQVNFRIPATLNERLKEAASENGRTITAELVYRLEQSFSGDLPGLEDIENTPVPEILRIHGLLNKRHAAEMDYIGAYLASKLIGTEIRIREDEREANDPHYGEPKKRRSK